MSRIRAFRPAVAAAIVIALLLAAPAAASLALSWGDAAEVAFTDGEGVNVRSYASPWADLLTTLPEGTAVTISDGPVTGDDGWSWYSVEAETWSGWVSGWVRADFLAGGGSSWVTDVPDALDDSDSAATGVPVLVSTGGPNLNLRSAPSIDIAVDASIPDGVYVEVLDTAVWDAQGNRWSLVRYGGMVGYAYSGYLVTGYFGGSGSTVTSGGAVSIGQFAAVTGTAGLGANVRGGPGTENGVVTALYDDSLVYVVDGPAWDSGSNDWYQIEVDGAYGWIVGRYLTGAGEMAFAASAGGSTAILDLAAAFTGVPYLWGGTTPAGFDCSGFTWYILSSIYGDWYPRPMEQQIEMGSWVAAENLLPGDVIYFQNTYQWGVSHVGFYMGDGLFISASGEHSGVGVSSLYDPYWSARYLTARRV